MGWGGSCEVQILLGDNFQTPIFQLPSSRRPSLRWSNPRPTTATTTTATTLTDSQQLRPVQRPSSTWRSRGPWASATSAPPSCRPTRFIRQVRTVKHLQAKRAATPIEFADHELKSNCSAVAICSQLYFNPKWCSCGTLGKAAVSSSNTIIRYILFRVLRL